MLSLHFSFLTYFFIFLQHQAQAKVADRSRREDTLAQVYAAELRQVDWQQRRFELQLSR